MTKLTVHVGNRARLDLRSDEFAAPAFREASRFYSFLRDESGEGASTFPEGQIRRGTVVVAKISYNGRVWLPTGWTTASTPIWKPKQEDK